MVCSRLMENIKCIIQDTRKINIPFFRNVFFELKYIFSEIRLMIKHPTRRKTYEDILYHWRELWGHIIFHPWYCLKRGIRNLWIWFPLIWKNDVFDYFFLTDMMDKQLSEMEKFWHSNVPMVMSKYHIAKRITWTRKLYRMWMDEYYSMKAYEEKEKLFGISEFKSKVCKVDEYNVPILYQMIDESTEDEKEYYRNKMKAAYEKDEKVYKLYIKSLYHIRKMWD